MERGAFASAIGTNDAEDAALFDAEIDAVERDGRAERFAETVCFYADHVSAPFSRRRSAALPA